MTPNNPNPLARTRRLGAALAALREQRGYNHAELGRKSAVSVSVISRLESPMNYPHRRPTLLTVRNLLDALDVPRGSAEWATVESYAEAAAARRWWDGPPYSRMGDGQKTYALVEAGASRVWEYSSLMLPGIVQTAAYARHRASAVTADGPASDPDAIAAGRLERQRRLLTGAEYHLVFEEPAVRRHPVPAPVMLEQLQHLLTVPDDGISVRVLPVAAKLGVGHAPRAPFGHISYPDTNDPPIVIVDNVERALLVTDPADLSGYAQLHHRLREAALSDADSAAYIREVAAELAATM